MIINAMAFRNNNSSCPASCTGPQNAQVNICPANKTQGKMGYQNQQSKCQLECQLTQINDTVQNLKCELGQVQQERLLMEQQRQMISPTAMNACTNPQLGREATCNSQLRELREQYNRLQDDFMNKIIEVATLRNENVQLRQMADEARAAQEAAEANARALEEKLKRNNNMNVGSDGQLIEQGQLSILKQRYREAQDELDDLRAIVQDLSGQLEDYKNKYIDAQEQVEEQRRINEALEKDNSRISEQVNLELQRIKGQFDEKLQELSPLPDLLTARQAKMKEVQQQKALADQKLAEMERELHEANQKIAALMRQMQDSQISLESGMSEKDKLKAAIKEWENKFNELKDINADLKTQLVQMDQLAAQNQLKLQEKLHEVSQLIAELESIREESARQVSRTKDRSEMVRRNLQRQISELEKELAQSRATARAAQKEREEVRQRMQYQINNLTDNFDQAQLRIRSLQSHVNFLKTSYTDMYGPEKPTSDSNPDYTFGSCDCNN